MPDRITCCVPFCRRTYRNDKDFREWICHKHWPLAGRRLRWLYAAWKRRRRRGHPEAPAKCRELWERCKARAIETALGL